VSHRGRGERDALLVPIIREALRAGHRYVVVLNSDDREEITQTIAEPGIDLSLLRLVDSDETYLSSGRFAGPEALTSVAGVLDDATQPNWIVADMSWMAPLGISSVIDDLAAHESAVSRWLSTVNHIMLCMYDLNLFDGRLILRISRVHPRVWMSGRIMDNPTYSRRFSRFA
jgi:hypothetical protein